MSKGESYRYSGTKGHIVAVAGSLPANPSLLIKQGWIEVTHPKQAERGYSREFYEESTDLRVRFDKGRPGMNGFRGIDHYHLYNPTTTGNRDLYLDSDGNPVGKGHRSSHIIPKGADR